MNYLITICIVNFNSSEFVLNTLYCLEIITKNQYKVIIRDNDSELKDYLNLKQNIINYPNVELYRVENFTLRGSLAHGTAINDLICRIDTKYGVILDADCTFLYKNWDDILIRELNEECPIIGTEAHKSKSMGFPLMYAILFDADIMIMLQIDFRPKNKSPNEDTGYRLREGFQKKGYKSKLLTLKQTRFYKEGPFRKLIVAEYYLNNHEEIFASHYSRGSTLGKNKYRRTWKRKIYVLPFIGNYLLISKGKREKKKFIKICQKIVDNINKAK